MRRYVSWIDIGFFASSPFMAMIVQLLGVERFQRQGEFARDSENSVKAGR
jgi:hypothetical protein